MRGVPPLRVSALGQLLQNRMSEDHRGQVPFDKLSMSFCLEDWALVEEGMKDIYRSVLKEIHRSLGQLGFSIQSSIVSLYVKREHLKSIPSGAQKTDELVPIHPDLFFWIGEETSPQPKGPSPPEGSSTVKVLGQQPVETPVTFQEVAVCICERRWNSLELKTKNLYTDILQDIHRTLTQLGHIIINPKTFIRVQDRDGHITKLSERPRLDSENLQLNIEVKEEEEDDILVTKAGTPHSETDSENSELNIVIKNEDGEEIPISEQTATGQSDGNAESSLYPVNRKRGRPRIYSPEVAQRRKIEAERRRRNTRVTIGQAWPLWMSLRAEKGFTNERLAFYLIDTYRRVCESENSEAILGRKDDASRTGDYHGIEVTVGFSGEESSSSEEEKVNGTT